MQYMRDVIYVKSGKDKPVNQKLNDTIVPKPYFETSENWTKKFTCRNM